MQHVLRSTLAISLLLFAMACGDSKKAKEGGLGEKKAELEKLEADYKKMGEDVKKLKGEIAILDTSAAATSTKIKLVSVAPVTTQNFQHFIDLQGKVDAENISYISPRGMGGQVRAIYVTEGQFVKKGQLLLKLDDAIVRQQIVAAKQGLETIKTQLSFAKNIYQRQKNLWDQSIGTEVQLISAKNNVESLENQLKGAEENVKVVTEQLNTSNVYSDVSGIADIVNIKLGETFTGMSASGPQIQIVNTSSLKVVTNVPENYISRMHRGSSVEITIPDANKRINSTISLISQSIDPTLRGFVAEAKIPYDGALKPNQTAIVKILDYAAANAVVIPVNLVQSDETSKYVYVLDKQSNGKTVAKKKVVIIGEVYGEKVEIKTGLSAGEQIITEGFQNLYEGQTIATN
ncbi:MAG: efflux RND transporter periplasmic adaptor subunit [Bacteroidota bacterium]